MNQELSELFAKQSEIFQQFLHPLTDQKREELINEMSGIRDQIKSEIMNLFSDQPIQYINPGIVTRLN